MKRNIVDMVKIRERYEITIPMEVREILNIEPGNHIQFEWDDTLKEVSVHKVVPQRVKNQAYMTANQPIIEGKGDGDGEEKSNPIEPGGEN